jgi:hypothetical protein
VSHLINLLNTSYGLACFLHEIDGSKVPNSVASTLRHQTESERDERTLQRDSSVRKGDLTGCTCYFTILQCSVY